MAQKKILVRIGDNVRAYGPKAAKIAINHLGGIEINSPETPHELRANIFQPPQITKPIPLKLEIINPPEITKPPEIAGTIPKQITVENKDIDQMPKKRTGRKTVKK